VLVYGDANDRWVPTRRIWNQHAYHVTNVSVDGSIPATETDNWTVSGLNNYRTNVQGEGAFNAPDLVIDLSATVGLCSKGITLHATVTNAGSLGVPAGVVVGFFWGTQPNAASLAGTTPTTKPLLPGQSEQVELGVAVPQAEAGPFDFVAVVDYGEETGAVDECLEYNNQAVVTGVSCATPR
jgi:hypothetical protein